MSCTDAPARAAATAWLPPLPPGDDTSEEARTVCPGRGKASTVKVRSALTLPTTQTRAAITVKASPALLPDTCRTRERGSIRWVNECARSVTEPWGYSPRKRGDDPR